MTLPSGYMIDQMTRPEAEQLFGWAAAEGWNPGLGDLDVAWDFDPQGFIALRKTGPTNSELVGGGAILSYGGRCGFMGLFIMRADHRRMGLGKLLWHERLRRLKARLHPHAWIAMDGVFDMAPFYSAGGFTYLHRDLRFQGVADATRLASNGAHKIISVAEVPQAQLLAYDESVFSQPRGKFLQRWLEVPGGHGVAIPGQTAGELRGYAFMRPCVSGHKLGPVFAEDPVVARSLIRELLTRVPGQTVAMDIPEPNSAALEIVQELHWSQSFGCARMIHGPLLPDNTSRTFGVTSFEFG
jgi:GNAT superfamily N-acetyltransferase